MRAWLAPSDVRAGNQQQETDGGEQHQQQRFDIADNILLHRHQSDANGFVGIGKGRGQIARDDVHIGFSLLQRYARFQPSDDARAHRNAAIAKRGIVPLANGSVNVAVLTVETKTGGDDAHDGIRGSVEDQRLANDVRSSSGRNVRPSTGLTRRVEKNSAEIM